MSELITYEQVKEMAVSVAKSGLFGVKTPEQAITIMLLAQSEGIHPITAARDYDIIQGRPAKKSEAMLRSFLADGGKVEWHKLDDTIADATFIHPTGGSIRIVWDIERAKKAGLTSKTDSMYTKYPRQMLRSRVVSEGVRTVCPGATGGLMAPEEIEDIPRQIIKPEPGKSARLEAVIDAQTEAVQQDPVVAAIEAEFGGTETGKKFVEGIIDDVQIKNSPADAAKPWTTFAAKISGNYYGTFDKTLGKKMTEAWDSKQAVRLEYSEREYNGKMKFNAEALYPQIPV